DSSSDQCKCNSGYIIGTSGQCVSAISYCSTQLGVMSRYNSISKKCECMIGYEFNGSGCVYKTINYPTQTYKKNINQNNAKNIDTFNPNDWVEVPTPTQKDSPDILSFNYGQSDTATSTSTTTAINKSSFWGKMSHYLNPFSWFKK
ncbi:MAG: hypothetical protein NTU76_00160, partial [Candidatus Taylorbacteria bacterium]|nr:hypothetical protein [Candidatus Taylorbacteria bacterium]